MRRVVAVVALMLLISACAMTEAERYTWNRSHPRLCPNARWLSDREIDEIARAVAHATPQTIMAISSPKRSRRELSVTTCYSFVPEVESPNRNLFGFCTLEKTGNTWRVTYVAKDLSPSIAIALACADANE